MNSTQLRCFLTVAETGSVSEASAQLFMAQPSVSRYLAQLEAEWQVSLFRRTGRGMELTQQGTDYYLLCTRFLKDLQSLQRKHLEDPAGDYARISYAVFPAWNVTPLLQKNEAYVQSKHPGWEISMKIFRSEQLLTQLRDGQVDLLFFVGQILRDEPDLVQFPLLELPQVLLYSAEDPAAGKPNLQPADFCDRDLLYVPDTVLTEEMMRRQVRSIEKRYGFPFHTRPVENPDALNLYLESGRGVALMDYWSRSRNNPNLKALALDLPLQVVLTWRKDCPDPAVPRFAQDTAEYLKNNLY